MDRAQPGAKGSLTHNLEAGAAWGQFSEGWIVPGTQPSRPARGETAIDETVLNAFAESHTAGSLTVTVDPGEAFVDGWLARDTSTDVDLAASTNGQTVYVGWDVSAVYSSNEHANRDEADTVIVGLEAAFQELDPKVSLWTFDTDGSGVTAVVDERDLGPALTADSVTAAAEFVDPGGVRHSGEIADLDDTGLTYVTTTSPPPPEIGETWLNPATGILYVGAETGWQSVPPTQVLQEAITFRESGVSLSTDDVVVSQGSLILAAPGSVDYGPNDFTTSNSGEHGLRINPNHPLTEIDYGTRTGTNLSSVELRDMRDSTVLDSVPASGGETVRLSGQMEPGVEYGLVEVGADDVGYVTDSAAASTPAFDVVSAFDTSHNHLTTRSVSVPATGDGLSGSATVSWPTRDVDGWDLATYQATPGGGSVTVDVVDASGNLLFSDISPQFNISTLDAVTDPQLRFTLERPDTTATSPTVEYAARRLIR